MLSGRLLECVINGLNDDGVDGWVVFVGLSFFVLWVMFGVLLDVFEVVVVLFCDFVIVVVEVIECMGRVVMFVCLFYEFI